MKSKVAPNLIRAQPMAQTADDAERARIERNIRSSKRMNGTLCANVRSTPMREVMAFSLTT